MLSAGGNVEIRNGVEESSLSQENIDGTGVDAVFHSQPMISAVDNADAAQKDGHYFLQVVQAEEDRINSLCAEAELDLNGGMVSDEGTSGRLRATIGKAHLLTTKKFRQFRQLCDKNLTQDADEQFKTTSQDLAGFWDLVVIQIDDVQRMFVEIEALRRNGWKEEIGSSLQSSAPTNNIPTSPTLKSLPRTHHPSSVTKSSLATAKSKVSPHGAKSDTAKVAREEARKRLMMAKAAGRQRKASETDDAEVQIFVS
jgi:discs large-associated protein 1